MYAYIIRNIEIRKENVCLHNQGYRYQTLKIKFMSTLSEECIEGKEGFALYPSILRRR